MGRWHRVVASTMVDTQQGRNPIDRVSDLSVLHPIKVKRSSMIGRDQSDPYRLSRLLRGSSILAHLVKDLLYIPR